MRGAWFSWEKQNTMTEMDPEYLMRRGEKMKCVDMRASYNVNYTMVFRESRECFKCMKFLVRTLNVLEKMESM